MGQTRRETLVSVLQGTNGYSLSELNAMNAISTVSGFLSRVEAEGISHTALAERLVAFKHDGGSGLSNAIKAITCELDNPVNNADAVKSAVSAIQAGLTALVKAVS